MQSSTSRILEVLAVYVAPRIDEDDGNDNDVDDEDGDQLS